MYVKNVFKNNSFKSEIMQRGQKNTDFTQDYVGTILSLI